MPGEAPRWPPVTVEVIGSHRENSIAVLRTSADLPAAALGMNDDVRIGQPPVLAVGSPLGLNGTVTSGPSLPSESGHWGRSAPRVERTN